LTKKLQQLIFPTELNQEGSLMKKNNNFKLEYDKDGDILYLTRGKLTKEDSEVYRVALGDLIPSAERKTFPPPEGSPERRNKTGKIGFMDVIKQEEVVLKKDAKSFPNPISTQSLSGIYRDQDYERITALVIFDIGIEEPYRNNGYATYLKLRAEELAQEWGLGAVVSAYLQSPRMRRISRRLGYTLYDGGRKAFKRLNHC